MHLRRSDAPTGTTGAAFDRGALHRMSSRPTVAMRAALAALVALMLVSVAPSEAEAAGRVRPYKEGGAIRLDTDLLSISGLSAWTIDEYLEANTPLPRLGSAFLAAERKYGINAKFLLAAALHESNWGRSGLSRAKHNLFGYNAYDRDPFKYATAFDGYAAGIDGVARFMKEAYLVPSGRWWVAGAPTLRSMQRFWSSSGVWGVNVSRIASSLRFDSLRKRKIVFAAPVLPGIVRTGDPLPVELSWRGGRIPAAITYRATWAQLSAAPTGGATAAATSDAVTARETLEPAGLGAPGLDFAPGLRVPPPATPGAPFLEPYSVKAKRTGLSRSSASLRLVAPREPGEYLLTVTLRDRDGKTLPRADARTIPTVRVQVSGAWAVRYGVEQLPGGGVRVTATNVGHQPIPINPLPASVADRLGPGAVRQTALALRAFDTGHPAGFEVAAMTLAEPLGRGASVTLVVPELGAVIPTTDAYLVPELLVHDDPDRLAGSRPAGFWSRAGGS
jgi:hypothetical protein